MVKPAGDQGLALETLNGLRVSHEVGREYLDRDICAGGQVGRQEDRCHPTFTDLPPYFEPFVEDGAGEIGRFFLRLQRGPVSRAEARRFGVHCPTLGAALRAQS